tara:strand:- start:166 stop:600 length:435 start_codon:yes stop_codon:yes gene_type:complete
MLEGNKAYVYKISKDNIANKTEITFGLRNKGMVEALTLSRWLQPFTESDEFDIEKSSIVTVTSASYALNNYYQFMLNSYSEADAESNQPIVQPKEEEFEDSEEMREMFNEYVSALSGQNKEKEIVKEEISEEDLDSLPISNTKH